MMTTAFCGLAVDATDAFRGRTMLQATADSAALAAVIDLPDRDTAAAAARTYAARNMAPAAHGQVLAARDIAFGTWDAAARALRPGAGGADTVHVTVRRAAGNGNAWPAALLRIAGVSEWDIAARAAAQRFIPGCLTDGLVARGTVDLTSGNSFAGGVCVHGNAGVEMQNRNQFAAGVTVSMPDLDLLSVPAQGLERNPGLAEALRENVLDPRMVDRVDALMQRILDRDPTVLPTYIDPHEPVARVGRDFDLADAEPGRIYHVDCQPNQQVNFSARASVSRVAIVAECRIHLPASATLTDVILASRSGGNGSVGRENITMAGNVRLGADDACAEGGGVQIFSNASIGTAATTTLNGVQMVAAGNIRLTAGNDGINGVSAQAGGDITMTANNAMGACGPGTPGLFTAWYYRLVL